MGQDDGRDEERPAHRVVVSPFRMARCQVTNADFAAFRKFDFTGAALPVVSVSWFDAVAYCEWLSGRTNMPYRLPTEAEWERAARGGLEGKLYTWGDEPPQEQPRYSELWLNGPEVGGGRPPNGFGLCDISENVHEWCSDWYGERYYELSPSTNPRGPVSGARRASRGGSWRHQIKITRVAARSSIPPEFRYSDYGFRCALSL